MKNNIKVAIITTSMPRYIHDNRSPFILDLGMAIKSLGNNVSIISMHVPNTSKEEVIGNIHVKRLPYFFERYELLQETRAGIPAAWRKNKFSIFLVLFFLVRLTIFLIIHGHEFDVIHANWTLSSLSAVISKPFHKRPVVTTLHGSDIFSASKYNIFKFPTKISLKGSNKIICVSTALQNEILQMGIAKNIISVIPNGITTDYFYVNSSIDRKKEILFVGSLTQNKGVRFLLESFSQIHKKYPKFSLRIIGDGPEEKFLKKISKKLGLEENVTIHKSIPHNEIGSVMRKSYMFVLPSFQEGFGVVLLEALASGLPCIAFASGGVKDVLGDGRGILVEPGNAKELTSAMEVLINDYDLYKALIEKGQTFSRQYSWDSIAKRVVSVYEKILN